MGNDAEGWYVKYWIYVLIDLIFIFIEPVGGWEIIFKGRAGISVSEYLNYSCKIGSLKGYDYCLLPTTIDLYFGRYNVSWIPYSVATYRK